MHWFITSRVNNGHGSISVASPIMDIIFCFVITHDIQLYVTMRQFLRRHWICLLGLWAGAAHASSSLMMVADRHEHGGRGEGIRAESGVVGGEGAPP